MVSEENRRLYFMKKFADNGLLHPEAEKRYREQIAKLVLSTAKGRKRTTDSIIRELEKFKRYLTPFDMRSILYEEMGRMIRKGVVEICYDDTGETLNMHYKKKK